MSPLILKPSVRVVAFNAPIAADWNMILSSNRRATFTPSDQQQAMVDAYVNSSANIIMGALAGTGKTSSMLLLMYAMDCFRSASTTHQLGKQSVDNALNRPRVDKYKAYKHLEAITPLALRGHPAIKAFESTTVRLLGLVKANLTATDPDTLDELATKYSLAIDNRQDSDGGDDWRLMEQAYELIPELLARTTNDTATQDFDDMLYLPVALNLPMVTYDVLMVDESQDLNALQIELILRSGHRHVIVGDENQAIYAFRGADAEAMRTMRDRLAATPEGVTVLPLTVTRRCPTSVVTMAKQIVPAFEAADDAPQGRIEIVPTGQTPEPGDMVLCRTNAPLISGSFRCLASGVPARIQGRDIGAGLKRFVLTVSNEKTSIIDMLDRLVAFQQRENAKLAKLKHAEEKMEQLQDKMDCVLALTNSADVELVGDLCRAIDSLFDDTRPSTGFVLFSSVHRAKGLEANVVRILEPEKMPHPMARSPQAYKQEMNVLYVAITRSKHTLKFHGTPTIKVPEPPKDIKCPTCDGIGNTGPTWVEGRTIYNDCPRCGGTGTIRPIVAPTV